MSPEDVVTIDMISKFLIVCGVGIGGILGISRTPEDDSEGVIGFTLRAGLLFKVGLIGVPMQAFVLIYWLVRLNP